MKTDKTDNELIAEFMGFERYGKNYFKCPNVGNDYAHGWTTFKPEELTFADRWDSLMPVVEKIAKHVYETFEHNNGYKNVTVYERAYPSTFGMIDSDGKWMVRINRQHLESEDTLIEATYKSVVEFIKWYNSNKNL